MKLTVIGAGTFGTAIANSLKNKFEIVLYTRNKFVVDDINTNRKNTTYFNNKVLSKQIHATSDAQQALDDAEVVFICLPSYLITDFFHTVTLSEKTLLVNGAKGFGKPGLLIPDALHEILPNKVASFKGPSFANEMIFEIPTAFTVAIENEPDFALLKSLFRKDLIILDHSKDIKGVELMSVVKNVYAIIIGVVDAIFNSANVRFLIFTKVLAEIRKLLQVMQINESVIYTYAGIGDLGLTSLNDLSRNRTLGLLIGKGFWQKQSQDSNVILEGFKSLQNVLDLLPDQAKNQFYLLQNLNHLLNGKLETRQFVNNVISENIVH